MYGINNKGIRDSKITHFYSLKKETGIPEQSAFFFKYPGISGITAVIGSTDPYMAHIGQSTNIYGAGQKST
jgi:hypothetical protein